MNPQVGHRSFGEAESYGLKISQLLLPVDHDRIKAFERIKRAYNKQTPVNTENNWATLGVIGSIGFLLLIGRIFLRRKQDDEEQDANKDALSHFTLAGVLLATIGGFSILFAMSVLPGIRCYNRISVFLGFFALAAFFIFLQGGLKKRLLIESNKIIWSLSLFFLAIGIFSQTSTAWGLRKKRPIMEPRYRADKAFIEQIEATLPPHSMIFQLPYMSFPESDPVGYVYSYDHFRAPLFSNTLKWSFGAIKGRAVDLWQRKTASYPLVKMIDELISKGFSGIYLNRMGYKDNGAEIEAELSELLQVVPLTKADVSFWDLHPYAKKLSKDNKP